jgi:hypothetical protein
MGCLAGHLALWLGVSLAVLRLPTTPPVDPGLDASWALCLPYFFQHGMQFGRDVVFTFGPLGFVISRFYCGSGFWLQVTAMGAVAGIMGWVLAEAVRPLKWPWKVAAIPAVLLLIAPGVDILYLLVVALTGLLLLRDEEPGPFKTALCCVILGFLSMTKFTNFMLAGGVVAIVAGYECLERKWGRAALVAGGFGVAALGWWIACGQSPLGLPRYAGTSLAISKGFEDAMFVYERPAERQMGIAMGLLLVAYGAFEAVAAKRRARGFAMVLIFWAGTYLCWKHSFVRADRGHLFGFYLWALAPVALNPVFFPYGERWRLARVGLLAAIGLLAIDGVHRREPRLLSRCVTTLAENARGNVAALSDLPAFKRRLDSGYAAVAARNAAPRIVEAVGNGSVDVLGYTQAVAIYNGLHYTPRPAFQSYCALTPELAGMNAAFLYGERAPEWILQRYENLDHNYPAMEDGQALRALLDRYAFQFQDSGYIVWRRAAETGKRVEELPPAAREGEASMNQEIPVDDFPRNSNLWLEVDYSYTVAGSLRRLLYKPPMVSLEVRAEDQPGTFRKFRYPRLLAGGGTLLSPYLEGEYDFLTYAMGGGGPTVESFKVDCDRENAKYVKRKFHYRLRILPAPENVSANRAMAKGLERYPMFDAAPSRVDSAAPATSIRLDGQAALEVCAPSEIEFAIPPGARRLRGGFGLESEAGSDKRPVAEFQVVLRAGGTQRVLLDRVLDPANVPGDHGLEALDVALPAVAADATVVLKAISKTDKEEGGNLTCWTGIRLAR